MPNRQVLKFCCSRGRRDSDALAALSGAALPRLIYDVNGKALTDEDRLVTFPIIRGGFPGRAQASMPHDQRQLTGTNRDLVLHVGVIGVQGLTGGRWAGE